MIRPIRRGWVSWPRSRPRCGGWRRWSPGVHPPEEVFAAVTDEAGRVLGVDFTTLDRYRPGRHDDGRRRLGPDRRARTFRSAPGCRRRDTTCTRRYSRLASPARLDPIAGDLGSRWCLVARGGLRTGGRRTPVTVEGQLWGVIIAGPRARSRCRRTPRRGWPGSPRWWPPRSRTRRPVLDLARFAEEQAALRRVATLVARATSAGGGVRRGRRGGRPAAGGRLRDPGPLRPAGHARGRRHLDQHGRCGADPGRRPAAARRPERNHAGATAPAGRPGSTTATSPA